MSRFPDFDAIDYAYDVLNRINDTQGQAAATIAARAMVKVGADIAAGRAVAVKSADGVQVRYKQAPDLIEQALDRLRQAAQSAGAMAADDQIVAQIDALAAALGRLTTPAGQRLEAKMKVERGLNPHGLRDDQGRLFGAPVRPAPAVVTTKAAQGDAIGELARQTAPQLYAKKGQKR